MVSLIRDDCISADLRVTKSMEPVLRLIRMKVQNIAFSGIFVTEER